MDEHNDELYNEDAEEFAPQDISEEETDLNSKEQLSEPVGQDLPAPVDSSNSITMISPGKSKGVASLAALKKLKLLKVKLIIVGAVIVFFAFIILAIMLSKEVEVKYDYLAPTCKNILIHFEHREGEDFTMNLENYVETMVYSLTKEMSSPKRVLYQAIAVAVRTNAQLLDNCTLNVSDEVDAYYDFEVLDVRKSRYQEIHNAVSYVQNLVMVENQQFVEVEFDSFCYSTNDGTNYTLKNKYYGPEIPTSWVTERVPELFRDCPCTPNTERSLEKPNKCWVEELFTPEELKYVTNEDGEEEEVIYYVYVDGGDQGEGLSVYTAYYLSLKPGYDDEKILRFFYPGTWDYYTIDLENAKDTDPNGALTCSYIDFSETPLSRDEFISLVQSYLSGKSSQTARIFYNNAGLIYDLGKQIGANPELVYIVAEKEYGWHDREFTLRCNNFYGLGVTNGSNSGMCFASFEAGVQFMLNYVKGKGNLTNFTKVYSYLGTYLANPGSAGDGGCYYLKLPEIYGPNYSRCADSYRCASSRGGTGCVLTTEAEKQAYIDWQASKILKIRSNIFHLDEEDCSLSAGFGADVAVGDAGSVNSSERMKWLFPSGVPKTEGELKAYMTTISVPVINVDGKKSNRSLTVHKKLAQEITAIFEEMVEMGFPVNSAGGYNYRNMASGTGSLSHHAYGVAIDINASDNPAIYQSGSVDKNSPYYINSNVVALWKKHGFYWGGDWSRDYYDPMHFTYTNH